MAGLCRLSAEKPTCQRLPAYDHYSRRRALARREDVQRPLTTRIDRVEFRLNHFAHELRESSPWLPTKCSANLIRTTDQPLIKGLRDDLFTEDEGMILEIREVPEPPAILHKLKPEV